MLPQQRKTLTIDLRGWKENNAKVEIPKFHQLNNSRRPKQHHPIAQTTGSTKTYETPKVKNILFHLPVSNPRIKIRTQARVYCFHYIFTFHV